MEIVIKTILQQIITQCAGTQDIIKKIRHMWSMWKKKLIENGCVSFEFKYIIDVYLLKDLLGQGGEHNFIGNK